MSQTWNGEFDDSILKRFKVSNKTDDCPPLNATKS